MFFNVDLVHRLSDIKFEITLTRRGWIELSKNKKDKKKLKRLAIPILGIADNIVFGDKEVWAYYKISTVPFEFLSGSAKAQLANNAMTALSALCQSEGRKVDGHILITNTPFDIESWASQIGDKYSQWQDEITEPFNKFIRSQKEELASMNYSKPVVYLGVKLFNRASFDLDTINIFEFGWEDVASTFKKAVSNLFVLPNENITKFEEDKARGKEDEIRRTLATGSLKGVPVTSEEILLTLKRQFYPAMPSPYLEVDHGGRIGLSDIAIETGGVLENHYRYLKFSQEINGEMMEGYRATMSFAKFPADMSMPGSHVPFLYYPASRGLPYTMNARFTMIPHNEMKRELEKKKLESDDELKNLSQSGQGAHAGISSSMGDIATMELQLEDSKQPWVNGAYRMTIEASTFDELKSRFAAIKQEYSEADTTVIWTTGDQLDLFIEEMPGSNIKMNSFNQKTSLAMIGVSGFNIGGDAGDPVDEQLVLSKRRKGRK